MFQFLLNIFLFTVCVSARNDLIETFLRTLDSPLSSLPYSKAAEAFHVFIPWIVLWIDYDAFFFLYFG